MRDLRNLFAIALIGAVGFLCGYANQDNTAQAETRQSAPRVAFQSGSERSLAILQKIEQRLATIDQRLERFEKSLPKTQ